MITGFRKRGFGLLAGGLIILATAGRPDAAQPAGSPGADRILRFGLSSGLFRLRDVYREFASAHQDAKARQVFITYRIERLEPLQPGMLDSMQDILTEYRNLKTAAEANKK